VGDGGDRTTSSHVHQHQTLMTAGLAMTIALVLLSAVRKLDSNCPIPQTEIQTKDRRFDRLP
jgi:hypothetical protein